MLYWLRSFIKYTSFLRILLHAELSELLFSCLIAIKSMLFNTVKKSREIGVKTYFN